MNKKLYTTVLLLAVLSAMYSCRKEKISFSNIPIVPEVIDTPQKVERHEVLTAVYDFTDLTRPAKLQISDVKGNILKEKVVPTAVMDFRRWEINGKYQYSYVTYDPTIQRMPGVGYIPGPVVILDENLDKIQEIRLLPHNGRTQPEPVDGHEFIYLDQGHYIVMAYREKKVNNIPAALNPVPDARVVSCIIQEVKNGQVVFEWDGTNYPEFYTTSVAGNAFSDANALSDYLHVNSIFVDPNDGNLIVSCRNTDQVIKISRTDGKVLWRLGGINSDFNLNAEQMFYKQHHATVVDNGKTLLIFDNGDGAIRPYSRVVEFKLNEVVRTVTGFKAVDVPENTFGQYMGSVQKTDSSYFIGCGSAPMVYEIDLITQQVMLSKKLEAPSYRSFKY